MNRRHFLKSGVAGSAAAMAMGAYVAEGSKPQFTSKPSQGSLELQEATIADLSAAMAAKKLTSVELTKDYLRRIQDFDQRGPKVNSIIEINPDALAIAEFQDHQRKTRGPRSPMHGIPVIIKDNIATRDNMMTTAGSLALVGVKPPDDAYIVKRLRAAGAVIIGKSNLSEWANIRSTHSTSGWSGRGGLTCNPYVLDRNPSGSSSGSAAAVSANFCAAAIGTETDGSIVSPASLCGVVGLKPTLGFVSRYGIVPIAHSQDTAGPMTRTVMDAAILLSCIGGADPNDPATADASTKMLTDYTPFLDPMALHGTRLGVMRHYFGQDATVDKLMTDVMAVMKERGATLIDPLRMTTEGKYGATEDLVLSYELKADLNKYLEWLGPSCPVHSLADLIEFNERNKAREMPWFGQEYFIKAQACGPLTDETYRNALANNHRLTREEGIDALMDKYELDALIAPSGGPAAATDLIYGDRGIGGCSSPAAVAGYPHITVPMGFVHGLPVGISFFGRAWSEPKLLALAYSFEQTIKARKPPQFLPTVSANT